MDYIVILDHGQRNAVAIEDENGFIIHYPTYDKAKLDGEEYKKNGDCRYYAIYAQCTDESNQVI